MKLASFFDVTLNLTCFLEISRLLKILFFRLKDSTSSTIALKTENDLLANLVNENLHLEDKIMHQQMIKNSLLKEKLAETEKSNTYFNDTQPAATEMPRATQSHYHWSVYKEEPMPVYIVEAKKRLGQIRQPHRAPNANEVESKPPRTPVGIPNKEMVAKHWSQYENPSTPDNVKQIRKRLGDDRYRRTELTRSKSFNNLVTEVSKPEKPNEPYKIPSLNIKNTIEVSADGGETGHLVETSITNMLPVHEEYIQNFNANSNMPKQFDDEVASAVELARNYEETHPIQERLLNSRGSNDSRMSIETRRLNSSKGEVAQTEPDSNMIPLDTWLKSHASEQGTSNSKFKN